MKKKPLHYQIRQDLLGKIESGVYKTGTIIPKEVDLAEYYNVSRPTVRQAIQALVSDGYLERRKKRGTIVKKKKISQDFTHHIISYDEEMKQKQISHKTNVLNLDIEESDYEVSDALNISEGDEVYKLVRLRYANDEPNVLVTSYLPVKGLPDLLEIDFSQISLYSTLNKHDLAVKSVTRTLDVIQADELTANLLNIEKYDPIFYFHTIGRNKDNTPIEYSIAWYRGDVNSFQFNINI